MRSARLIARILTIIVGAGLAVGCGSGGTQVAGIDGGGSIASGVITGFGSVFVNGVEYRTTGAQITINGQPGTEAQLHVGEVVTVRGVIASGGKTGDAQSISFDDNVTGPITSIDLPGNSLVVLGQTVRTDGTTTFDNSSIQPPELGSLAVGDIVEVSGFVDANGAVVATRIERRSGSAIEVSGTIENLDTNAKRFQVNALIVDYSTAQLSGGSPSNGACVEAKGDSAGFSGGVLTASRVEVEGCQPNVTSGDHGEIEGLITAVRSTSDFDVAGQRVATTAATQFSGGTPANLAANARVEVEGTFDAAGTLVASKLEFKQASELRATGTIESLNAASSTLTVFGIPITTDSETRFEDDSSQNVSTFNFSSLRTNDYVEVHGSAGTAVNSLRATVLERRDPDTKRELRGPAVSLAAPTFTILGVSVVTDAGTTFMDDSDNSITSAQFFALAAGRVVNVDGTWTGSSFLASSAEIERP